MDFVVSRSNLYLIDNRPVVRMDRSQLEYISVGVIWKVIITT